MTRGDIAIKEIKTGIHDIWKYGNKFYVKSNNTGEYVEYTETQMVTKLSMMGISGTANESETFSPQDVVMEYVFENRVVSNVIPCCPAVEAGFYPTKKGFLVLRNVDAPDMVKGEFPNVEEYLNKAFGENRHYLLGAVKNMLIGLVEHERSLGHHICIAGEAGKGKSFLANLISHATGFDGYMVNKVVPFIKGEKDNLKEAFYNPWLLMDDEGIGNFNRTTFCENLKHLNYGNKFTIRALYGDAVDVDSCHKTMQLVNLNEEALKGVPALDKYFQDKLILLKISDDCQVPFPELGDNNNERNERLKDEYKAFAHWLYHKYEIPELYKADPLKGERGMVKAYSDPYVIELITESMPDSILIKSMIKLLYSGWYSASDICDELERDRDFKSLNLNSRTIGRLLSRICNHPEMIKENGVSIKQKKKNGSSGYQWVNPDVKGSKENMTDIQDFIKEVCLEGA